jgi:hypothetical protein
VSRSKFNYSAQRPLNADGVTPLFFRPAGIMLYLFVGILLLYSLPDYVVSHSIAIYMTNAVSKIVPSIRSYAEVSIEPQRTAFFMALCWCLTPLHVYFGYVSWVRTIYDKRPTLPISGLNAYLSALFFLIGVVAILMLPTQLSFDVHAIRPSREWGNWMHESILPHGLLALWLPPGVAALLLCGWLFTALPHKPQL